MKPLSIDHILCPHVCNIFLGSQVPGRKGFLGKLRKNSDFMVKVCLGIGPFAKKCTGTG